VKKTAGVNALVREALEALPRPYTENVIEDVFLAIEKQPELLARYESECDTLTKTVANNWVGVYTSRILGKTGARQMKSTRSSLAGSYSLLDNDARTIARKPNEEEARQLRYEYWNAHKDEWDAPMVARLRKFSAEIADLIMDGESPAAAFAIVLKE
jgi:hypothetical protein